LTKSKQKDPPSVLPEISFDFTHFPCFNGDRRPILLKGTARCRATKIEDRSTQNDPPLITWVVMAVKADSVELKRQDLEDFSRWLHGKHGFAVAKTLRDAIPPTAEDA
jgi:hypothetical protein